ncbi:MAG TPA: hypothetical protein PKL31_04075 [Fulvivirga sp.]|nr:hypothetical protein [Fulvivirga sp.]
MAAISRSPIVPFITGAVAIIMYFYVQFTTPLLSKFQKINGEVVKYETEFNRERRNNMFNLWLNDTSSKPYFNYYNSPQREINQSIAEIKQVTIWVNNGREIMQMETDEKLIFKYNWFAPIFLIILAIGLFFHIYTFKETKSKTTNINTYWDMWEYVFGRKVPIMKHNNKPYNPDDLFKF